MIMKVIFLRQSGIVTNHSNDYRICVPFKSNLLFIRGIEIFSMTIIILTSVVKAAPHAVSDSESSMILNNATWPPMQHYDIWSDNSRHFKGHRLDSKTFKNIEDEDDKYIQKSISEREEFSSRENLQDINVNYANTNDDILNSKRQNKVIHLFPVPVDGECLSNDGRRTGSCLNAYECRNKGGESKGECALGFGVCCIFIANCNETISNNITYLVSPSFPSFMASNVTNCSLKIKLMNDDISQLRIDFYHFILGQPNRRTGVCDGDIFQLSGGPGGIVTLCGQNSGQHIYYDVGGRMLPRHTLYGSLKPLRYEDLYPNRNTTNDTAIEIDLKLRFSARFLPTRLWEIRIIQIPFSQRAPAGCLQYFTGTEGIFQTFNFADNGRHLANQNYRICMRQEVDMCSIVYQPCDEQSFRIGPSLSGNSSNGQFTTATGGIQSSGELGGITNIGNGMPPFDTQQMQVLADDSEDIQTVLSNLTIINTTIPDFTSTTTTPFSSTTTTTTTTTSISITTAVSNSASENTSSEPSIAASSITISTPATSTTVTTEPSTISTPLSDDVEGSGGDVFNDVNNRFRPTTPISNVSRRPRPTRGGFDLLGFLRSAFDFGFRRSHQIKSFSQRQSKQFYSNCRDRITMPCIIEDFIDTGSGPLPGCEPIHCGMQFCSNGMWPCRIESTVTPFYVGIHFGDGTGKGSAEDNIGACLRYQQVQCM